jgi:hypothetical protein
MRARLFLSGLIALAGAVGVARAQVAGGVGGSPPNQAGNIINIGPTAAGNTSQFGPINGGILPSLDLNFLSGALDSRITFARASVGTYFDNTGAIQTAANNVPRFDHNPTTLAPLGLLMEEQRINLLLNSATLSTQSVTVTNVPTTLSFYGTGTVVLSGTGTGTLVGAGAFPARATLTITPTAGTMTATVTGTVTDAQIEAGAFATSYIPTTAATVTRVKDTATMTAGAPWFLSAKGTIEAQYASIHGNATVSEYAADISDASTNNRYALRIDTTGAQVATFLTVTATVATTSGTIATNAAGVMSKIAMTWTGSSQTGAGNGGAIQTTSSAAPVSVTTVDIGQSGGGGSQANAWIQKFRYWPRVLPNLDLQAVTSPGGS